jgi:hypothetical protein
MTPGGVRVRDNDRGAVAKRFERSSTRLHVSWSAICKTPIRWYAWLKFVLDEL